MSVGAAFFDAMYARSDDPWGFTTRWYEARKYALTLAALPRARYRRVFEPGCAIGALTGRLAERADSVVAMDVSAGALAQARRAALPTHVELEQGAVPHDWPDGRFDLIVFSELGYYLDAADLDGLVHRATQTLSPDGHLVAVHWRLELPGCPGDGGSVHRRLARSRLRPLAHYDDDHFLLDVYAGDDGRLPGPEDT